MQFKKKWRLYGMWALLDGILGVLFFALIPLLLGFQITKGLFIYAHSFILAIAFTLVIFAFVAFHKGCIINLCHGMLRNADHWWNWVVFHWALAVVVLLVSGLVGLLLGPLFASPTIRFLAIALVFLYILWMVHLFSLSQYFYLKRKNMLAAITEAWEKQLSRKLGHLFTDIIKYQAMLFFGFLIIETLFGFILSPALYVIADSILIPLYYASAFVIYYLLVMRNRFVLYG